MKRDQGFDRMIHNGIGLARYPSHPMPKRKISIMTGSVIVSGLVAGSVTIFQKEFWTPPRLLAESHSS